MKTMFFCLVACLVMVSGVTAQDAGTMPWQVFRPAPEIKSAPDLKWDTFTPAPVMALQRVIVYTTDPRRCEACKRLKDDAEFLSIDLDFRTDNHPDWIQAYPTLHWRDARGVWRQQAGWSGVDEFLRIFRPSVVRR